MPVDEAIEWAKVNGQPYKEELLNDLKRSGTTVAKDLDAAELGLAAEGDAAVEEGIILQEQRIRRSLSWSSCCQYQRGGRL